LRKLSRSSPQSRIRNIWGYGYGRAGRREEAEKFAAAAAPNALTQALTFAGFGRQGSHSGALERMAPLAQCGVGRALNSPEFDSYFVVICEWTVLRKKVGLPEAMGSAVFSERIRSGTGM